MKTIKELFGLEYDTNPENNNYSLPTWFNKMIDKTPEELSEDDIGIMLRQDICFDLAFEKAIELLENNPLAGYQYEGEILSSLANHNDFSKKQKALLKEIVSDLILFSELHEFEVKEFKDDYLKDLELLLQKID